jgi:hypothetical protein
VWLAAYSASHSGQYFKGLGVDAPFAAASMASFFRSMKRIALHLGHAVSDAEQSAPQA